MGWPKAAVQLGALIVEANLQWLAISREEEELLDSANTPSELEELHHRMRERNRAH
jgi:hypothetical protein